MKQVQDTNIKLETHDKQIIIDYVILMNIMHKRTEM